MDDARDDLERMRHRRRLATGVYEVPTLDGQVFVIPWEAKFFKVAATQDCDIDLAIPDRGTYPLSLDEAEALASALLSAVSQARGGPPRSDNLDTHSKESK